MAALTSSAASLLRPNAASPLRRQARQQSARPVVARRVLATASDAPNGVVLPKPPSPATEPTSKPVFKPAGYGWNANAERLNSRAAMIGFFALLIVEGIAGKGILEMLGFEVGNGIDINF